MTLEILTLADDATGSGAQILPSLGCNCFRFTACPAGQPLDVLWSAADYAQGTARPVGSGLPILFPFAGRIRGARLHFDGRDFDLSTASDDGRGNAVCLEPYTTIPDPFWLLQRGHDPRLIVLAPGQRWSASMTIRIE